MAIAVEHEWLDAYNLFMKQASAENIEKDGYNSNSLDIIDLVNEGADIKECLTFINQPTEQNIMVTAYQHISEG